MTSTCPPTELIARAVADPDAAATDLLTHVANCPRCRERLDPPEAPICWGWLSDPDPSTINAQPNTHFLQMLKAVVRTAAPGGPGPNIPGFPIESEIARGGMGVVYRATDEKLGRTVAIKVLPPDVASEPDRLARFLREAKALAALAHPNVVRLYQAGEVGGQPYLVMEYVPGGTLRQSLRAGPWEPVPAARLLRELADATDAAHRLGFIHRDIKPGNVLLEAARGEGLAVGMPSGAEHSRSSSPSASVISGLTPHPLTPMPSTVTAKLADFGLARFLDAADAQTATGEVLGTPEYMAPEQALGRADKLGPTTDVWALGVMLYEVLSGRPPFLGPSRTDTMRLVTAAHPIPVDRLRPEVSPDLAAICAKCLEKDPHRRYRTAAALRDDLDRFLNGQGVSARPRSWLGRARDGIRRHPLRALGLLALLALPGGAAAGAARAWQLAEVARRATEAELTANRERFAAALADLYAARIRLANEAELDGRTDEAKDVLRSCEPTPGDPDLRGWEWHYLMNRLRNPGHVVLKPEDALGLGFPPPPRSSEAVSPDGRRHASATAGGVAVRDQDGRTLLRLPVPGGKVIGLHFSADGRWLAARTADDSVSVFDGAPGGLAGE